MVDLHLSVERTEQESRTRSLLSSVESTRVQTSRSSNSPGLEENSLLRWIAKLEDVRDLALPTDRHLPVGSPPRVLRHSDLLRRLSVTI